MSCNGNNDTMAVFSMEADVDKIVKGRFDDNFKDMAHKAIYEGNIEHFCYGIMLAQHLKAFNKMMKKKFPKIPSDWIEYDRFYSLGAYFDVCAIRSLGIPDSEYVKAFAIFVNGDTKTIASQLPKIRYRNRFYAFLKKSSCNLIVSLVSDFYGEDYFNDNFNDGAAICKKVPGSSKNIYNEDGKKIGDEATYIIDGDHKIVRICFRRWPDRGCPDEGDLKKIYSHFFNVRKALNDESDKDKVNRTLVHCLAGIERTTLFITYDLIKKGDVDRKVTISELLDTIMKVSGHVCRSFTNPAQVEFIIRVTTTNEQTNPR